MQSVSLGEEDSSRTPSCGADAFDMSVWQKEGPDSRLESLRHKFVTGTWKTDGLDDESGEFGEFEDLETGEKFGAPSDGIEVEDDADETDLTDMTDEERRNYHMNKKFKEREAKGGLNDEENDEDDAAVGENQYIDAMKREKEVRLARKREEFGDEGEATELAAGERQWRNRQRSK